MLRLTAALALFAAVSFAPAGLRANEAAADSDARTKARSEALEVAGAFSNDGFVLRDGHQWGTLEAGKPVIIQVNLFAGNHYWFVAAASPEAGNLTVTLYGEDGKPVAYEPYQDGSRAAAGFSPSVSGPYYVRITGDREDASALCFLYSYK